MKDDRLATVSVKIILPTHYLQEFLQIIRNFENKDANHFADCLVAVAVNAPSIPAEEVERIMQSIKPPFDDIRVLKKI